MGKESNGEQRKGRGDRVRGEGKKRSGEVRGEQRGRGGGGSNLIEFNDK